MGLGLLVVSLSMPKLKQWEPGPKSIAGGASNGRGGRSSISPEIDSSQAALLLGALKGPERTFMIWPGEIYICDRCGAI